MESSCTHLLPNVSSETEKDELSKVQGPTDLPFYLGSLQELETESGEFQKYRCHEKLSKAGKEVP